MDNQQLAHLLIVEDDEELAQWMQSYMSNKGYHVSLCHCGLEAVDLIISQQPDLVILDGMLPNLDGIEVCRRVRPHFNNAIIMVTARDEEIDEVLGLEMGADDYLTKPVRARALLTRVQKYLVKQTQAHSRLLPENNVLHFNQLTIDNNNKTITHHQQDIKLSTQEFELLWILASKAGNIVSRESLVKELRGFDYDGFDRSVDIKISRIRKKLDDDPNNPNKIKTIWGKGYLFIKEAF
ncbi:response regulator [Thalassotalea ganghwensis]